MDNALTAKMVSGLTPGELARLWKEAKDAERRAIEFRLSVEQAIEAQVELKPEGTTKIDGLVVVTGYARSWDDDGLTLFKEAVPPELWPFKIKWSEERNGTRWLEENEPDIWQVIEPALTVKPKKPAYSWKGGDGEK